MSNSSSSMNEERERLRKQRREDQERRRQESERERQERATIQMAEDILDKIIDEKKWMISIWYTDRLILKLAEQGIQWTHDRYRTEQIVSRRMRRRYEEQDRKEWERLRQRPTLESLTDEELYYACCHLASGVDEYDLVEHRFQDLANCDDATIRQECIEFLYAKSDSEDIPDLVRRFKKASSPMSRRRCY